VAAALSPQAYPGWNDLEGIFIYLPHALTSQHPLDHCEAVN